MKIAPYALGQRWEALHVYSLIHDDLPCMDDDALRRGKPTTHIAYGEAQAVLAGDALHALAFEVLADEATHSDPFVRAEMLACLAKAAGSSGMAGGQMMDIVAERKTFDLQTVTRLQQLKDRCANRSERGNRSDLGQSPAGRPRRAQRLCQ